MIAFHAFKFPIKNARLRKLYLRKAAEVGEEVTEAGRWAKAAGSWSSFAVGSFVMYYIVYCIVLYYNCNYNCIVSYSFILSYIVLHGILFSLTSMRDSLREASGGEPYVAKSQIVLLEDGSAESFVRRLAHTVASLRGRSSVAVRFDKREVVRASTRHSL